MNNYDQIAALSDPKILQQQLRESADALNAIALHLNASSNRVQGEVLAAIQTMQGEASDQSLVSDKLRSSLIAFAEDLAEQARIGLVAFRSGFEAIVYLVPYFKDVQADDRAGLLTTVQKLLEIEPRLRVLIDDLRATRRAIPHYPDFLERIKVPVDAALAQLEIHLDSWHRLASEGQPTLQLLADHLRLQDI
jgi:hypothetical protein